MWWSCDFFLVFLYMKIEYMNRLHFKVCECPTTFNTILCLRFWFFYHSHGEFIYKTQYCRVPTLYVTRYMTRCVTWYVTVCVTLTLYVTISVYINACVAATCAAATVAHLTIVATNAAFALQLPCRLPIPCRARSRAAIQSSAAGDASGEWRRSVAVNGTGSGTARPLQPQTAPHHSM